MIGVDGRTIGDTPPSRLWSLAYAIKVDRGWSFRDLAEATGTTAGQLQRLARGHGVPANVLLNVERFVLREGAPRG